MAFLVIIVVIAAAAAVVVDFKAVVKALKIEVFIVIIFVVFQQES